MWCVRQTQFIILYIWSKVTQRWKTSCGSNVSLKASQTACCFLLFGCSMLKKASAQVYVYCRILFKVSGLLDLACTLLKSSVCVVDEVLCYSRPRRGRAHWKT